MATADTLKDAVRICKTFVSFIRACYHWFRDHFIIFGLICILLIIFRVFPSVLRFFISRSPVFICTAIFLKSLLSFGQSDGTKDEEKTEDFSKIKYDSLVNMDPNENVAKKSNDDLDDIECSSSENAPINMLSVIDEVDPLLDSKVPQFPLMSADDLDSALESSDKSIDESGDSEAENQAKGNREKAKSLVNWTDDDQKNLMDLGSSELERNKRLASLIARRRARKNFLRLSDKSLIDFDSNDTSFQVPSITTLKNPFDVPYSSSEFDGLAIPGSAPSVLVPRKNPFDLPYDPQEERPNLTQDSFHQEYMQIFCRHESFSLGSARNRQDGYNSRFGSFFSDDETESAERAEFSNSNAQSSERRNSLFGTLPESDALPPIDPKNRKKKMGRVMSLGVYPSSDRRQRKFADVPWIRPEQEVKRDASINQETRNDSNVHYDESSRSSSSEINEEVGDVKEGLELNNIVTDDVKKQYSDPKEEALEDTDLNNRVMEEVKDARIKESSYDLSDSSSSIASDMHVEVSEAGSPRESFDRYVYSASLSRGRIDKKTTDSKYAIEEKEVKPTDDLEVSEHNAGKTGASGHVSPSENPIAAPVELKLTMEEPVESELHVEQDTITVDSRAPTSPSSDQHEECQETSIAYNVEHDTSDNVNIEDKQDVLVNSPKSMEAGDAKAGSEVTSVIPLESTITYADGDTNHDQKIS